MNGGINGEDCFLVDDGLLLITPLTFGLAGVSFEPAILRCGGMSRVGEFEGDELEGVLISMDVVVLELDLECVNLALGDCLIERLVIVQRINTNKDFNEDENRSNSNTDLLTQISIPNCTPQVLYSSVQYLRWELDGI